MIGFKSAIAALFVFNSAVYVKCLSQCIFEAGQSNERRHFTPLNNSECLGGDVHLSVESMAVGLGANGCIGSSALYHEHISDPAVWDTAPLGVIVDHDLDGMEKNFKGDFFTRPESQTWKHREGKVLFIQLNLVIASTEKPRQKNTNA